MWPMTDPQPDTAVHARSVSPAPQLSPDERSQSRRVAESEVSAPGHWNGAWGDLGEIAVDLWQHRDLLYQLTLRDIRIRYKQAVMGFAWAILMPTLIVVSGVLVRVAAANVSGRQLVTASIAGIAVKAIPWGFFVSALSFSTVSLTGNGTLVSKIYFPREVLPLSTVFAAVVDALIGSTVVVAVLAFLQVPLAAPQLWILPLAVLLFCLTTAAALFFSCANLFFRDVKYIVQVVLTFGIFFTPVFFDATMFGVEGSRVLILNPLAPLLEGIRLSVVNGHNLLEPLTVSVRGAPVIAWQPWYLLYSALWAIGGLLASAVIFHRAEFAFAEYL
jgi:ABC-type polysaccharide/polyol phosphate export permease